MNIEENVFLNKYIVNPLNSLSENSYLSAIRAGMVAVVPLTIVGSIFIIISYFPFAGWEEIISPFRTILEIPVNATFGLLAVFVCFSIGYDLGLQMKQEAIISASMSTLIFFLIQFNPEDGSLMFDNLGSSGIFTGIIIAFISVRIQKFFTDKNLVLRLPKNVPPVVYESFVSLTPLLALLVGFWIIRYLLGIDINLLVQTMFQPIVFAFNTLPGILVYAFLVAILWSIGINGDNAMDAIAAPIFLQYLTANVAAMSAGEPLPYITAYGFFTTFVNVGGTGATIALALIMLNSKEPGYRKISRFSLPTQIFQINEPIFFGFPIVLNPILMIPYVLNALLLTAGTYLMMYFDFINKPVINVPWTTPPIIGHYLVSGGDWRAALWGVVSLFIAMLVYFPFAKIAERKRLSDEAKGISHE
ncbi:MAG: PTS sugar transporter subunit IIC [Ignavibacteriae bacterium]|nr:PTS sugar transporter subunit IIC [Ignavibacteriota bacterium]MCB9210790.1 PTS sugar transporter subunit IIC [Ignavibacteriales bacterium]